jgi:hypothetical protein
MKRTLLTLAAAITLSAFAFAGTSDKVTLTSPLIVAATKEEAKNLDQMLQDGDNEGAKSEFADGKLAVIPPGSTIYVVGVGWDGVDTLRYKGRVVYAPNKEVSKLVYGNQ